jgi:hypothetical protein
MINDFDAYIEWLEPTNDISSFDTYIQKYIDCYANEFCDMVTNNTIDPRVSNFHPIEEINFTSENYFVSKYKGDNRAWRLHKLITILRDNPMRYEELLKYIYYKNREFVSTSYTYEADPHIYGRSIMDNKHHCDNAEERYVNFNEPHTFIKVYNSSCNHRYCVLYINGVRKTITYNMTFGSDMYIYFPCSYIENHENIHIDIGFDNETIADQTFKLDFVGGYYSFEDSDSLETNSLADLIYYVDGLRKYVDPKDIQYRLRILEHEIRYLGTDEVDTYVLPHTEILLSSENEIVQPIDYDFIILRTDHKIIDLSGIMYHKKIDLDNLEVSITNPSYEERLIHVASASFYTIRTFNITDDMINSTIEFTNFKGKCSKNRFHLFLNGKIVNPDLYDMEFPVIYNGSVLIKNIQFGAGDLVVEYISYDEQVVYDGTLGELKKTEDNILYLDGMLDLPLDVELYKVYIDGYRIHNNQIKTLGQNNMIIINDEIHEFTDDSEVLIYTQEMDKDPYQYDTSLHFLSEVSKDDSTFRKYLLDTYNK